MTLNVQCPCGCSHYRLPVAGVPREKYERRCKRSGMLWTVTRTLVSEQSGARFDKLEWEQARSARPTGEERNDAVGNPGA